MSHTTLIAALEKRSETLRTCDEAALLQESSRVFCEVEPSQACPPKIQALTDKLSAGPKITDQHIKTWLNDVSEVAKKDLFTKDGEVQAWVKDALGEDVLERCQEAQRGGLFNAKLVSSYTNVAWGYAIADSKVVATLTPKLVLAVENYRNKQSAADEQAIRNEATQGLDLLIKTVNDLQIHLAKEATALENGSEAKTAYNQYIVGKDVMTPRGSVSGGIVKLESEAEELREKIDNYETHNLIKEVDNLSNKLTELSQKYLQATAPPQEKGGFLAMLKAKFDWIKDAVVEKFTGKKSSYRAIMKSTGHVLKKVPDSKTKASKSSFYRVDKSKVRKLASTGQAASPDTPTEGATSSSKPSTPGHHH